MLVEPFLAGPVVIWGNKHDAINPCGFSGLRQGDTFSSVVRASSAIISSSPPTESVISKELHLLIKAERWAPVVPQHNAIRTIFC